MRVEFSVDGKAISTNATYLRSANRRLRKSDEAIAWQTKIKYAARRAMHGKRPLSGSVECSLLIAFPTQRNDIDGPIKGILDALQGIVYANDRQVRRLVVECYALTQGEGVEGRAVPGVDISVEEMTP